jgi:alkylation response protein AidB-like acyl-CoA dehydrogenase
MTIIDALRAVPSNSADPGQPAVVSGTSPLADGFRSRFFTDDDYRRFHGRAAGYDAQNAFFAEDFAEIAGVGYLKASLPERLGGSGLTLAELAREQRHLAL